MTTVQLPNGHGRETAHAMVPWQPAAPGYSLGALPWLKYLRATLDGRSPPLVALFLLLSMQLSNSWSLPCDRSWLTHLTCT